MTKLNYGTGEKKVKNKRIFVIERVFEKHLIISSHEYCHFELFGTFKMLQICREMVSKKTQNEQKNWIEKAINSCQGG